MYFFHICSKDPSRTLHICSKDLFKTLPHLLKRTLQTTSAQKNPREPYHICSKEPSIAVFKKQKIRYVKNSMQVGGCAMYDVCLLHVIPYVRQPD